MSHASHAASSRYTPVATKLLEITTIKKELNTLSVGLKHSGNRGWVKHSAAIDCIPPFAAQSEPRTRWLVDGGLIPSRSDG
ncbi:hypothetical protein BH11MYX2_BH11MYX2_04470 [soil metagenome]